MQSTTDRSKKINSHLGFVNVSPTDILEKRFETENNISFDPLKLDVNCPQKEIMSKAVIKILKKISDLSNTNLIKNADVLLSKKKSILKLNGLVRRYKGFQKINITFLIEFFFQCSVKVCYR